MNIIQVKTQKQETSKKEEATNNEPKGFSLNESFSFDIPKKDDRRLPRSPLYMETICAADLLSKDDEAAISKIREIIGDDATDELASMSADELENEIKEVIDEELPNKGSLESVVCRCYIEGCDCHEITPLGKIKEHFQIAQKLPQKLSVCRKYLQDHDDCTFVEVYSDCIIAISSDSTTSII